MIAVKHPDEACNRQQEEFISHFNGPDRRYHELLFSHGNASFRYHQEAKEFNPTQNDFNEWLEGLPDKVRAGMSERGFEACKGVLSFTRYVNEKHDIGMDEYVKQLMGDEYQ